MFSLGKPNKLRKYDYLYWARRALEVRTRPRHTRVTAQFQVIAQDWCGLISAAPVLRPDRDKGHAIGQHRPIQIGYFACQRLAASRVP